MPGTALLRQQLRFLWQPCHAESVLKVLPRFSAQGAAIFQRKDGSEPVARPATVSAGGFSAVFFIGGGSGFCGSCGRATRLGGGEDATAESVHDVQAARGADGIQVPVRYGVVRNAPLPGAARVRVRLQGDGKGADREGESGCEGREAREDLRKEPRVLWSFRVYQVGGGG
ncbi:hypothetical protein VNO78_14038 [Psophocarpus tetragonolobus]|uniref:Uncharacterized protein n=1 Tax=Psophocarpus tetragonolobus TaxID=3891 RepID=A0AAN9XPV7_PSOTE